jgi:ABC-2 type transport system permease protein
MLIFKRELRAHLRSTLIWCAGISFLILAGMGKYEAVIASGDNSMELFDTLPDSLKSIFGIGVFDLTLAIEYFAVLFLYVGLMLALQSCMLASSIVSKEERDRTSEFLLVKPVSRFRILSEKLLAALVISLIILLVTYGFSAVTLLRFAAWEAFSRGLFLLMCSGFVLQAIFLSIGAFFAGLLNRPKLASVLSSSTLLAMYFISMIVDLSKELRYLRYLTFFKYFDPKDILIFGHWPGYLVLSVITILGLIFGAYYFYQKRDMRI